MIDVHNKASLGSFLTYGYDVTYGSDIKFDYDILPRSRRDVPRFQDVKDLFLSAVENSVGSYQGDIVIPLSGGLDSRAILAAALELYSPSRIKTYTFGTEGTLDYDIGLKVAKELGVECRAFSLPNEAVTLEDLELTASLFDYQTLLFFHPPYRKILSEFGNAKFLIGFMGDPIAGSHLSPVIENSTSGALEAFHRKNSMLKGGGMAQMRSDWLSSYVTPLEEYEGDVSYEEYLDFSLRQSKYIYPHVMPRRLNCASPFIDKGFYNLMMSLPFDLRLGQNFYNEFLLDSFPKAFSLPCKNNYGLSLSAKPWQVEFMRGTLQLSPWSRRKMTNYQDFNRRICEDSLLYKLFYVLLGQLSDRNLGVKISPLDFLKQHVERKPVYSMELILLASLEINLKGL